MVIERLVGVEMGVEVLTQVGVTGIVMGEPDVQGCPGIGLVAEVYAYRGPDAVLGSKPHKVPMGRCGVDVGQGQRSDARRVCFRKQFTRLHEPIAKAKPRVAMQVHSAWLKERALWVVVRSAIFVLGRASGFPHPEQFQTLMDFKGVFWMDAFADRLKEV